MTRVYVGIRSFAQVWLAPTVRLSRNNCVKTNKDRHTVSGANLRHGLLIISSNIRFVRIFARVLRKDV